MTIFSFLADRLIEDRGASEDPGLGEVKFGDEPLQGRLITEIEVKQKIIDDHLPDVRTSQSSEILACRQCTASIRQSRMSIDLDIDARVEAPCDTIRYLASIYEAHPDYQSDWRP